jgi:hypothetical protein
MATVTLVYRIRVGNQDPAALLARAEAVEVDPIFEPLSMAKVSDVTAVVAPGLTRTIELETDAESDAMFPTDENKIAATRGLCTGVLSMQLPALVTADEPVVS